MHTSAREGGGETRRLNRAVKLLRRGGVNRLLPRMDYRPEVAIPWVDPMPLYRGLAHRLILHGLAERGVPPQRAVVVLRGEYPDGDLIATAYRLCPEVRQVLIDTRRGGAQLQRRLYRDFGVTAGPVRAEERIFRVCFDDPAAEAELSLCAEDNVRGIRLDASEVWLPDGVEREPALCALWQAGLLALERIEVSGTDAGNKIT